MNYMTELLRQFASSLMVPVFVLLFILMVCILWAIGSLLVEYFTERRHFKENLPQTINDIESAAYPDLNDVICASGMLWPQKSALLLVANNAGLPEDSLFALAKAETESVEARYDKIIGRTDLMAKISPMVGLMCTLIPLGPGIVAMGQGQMEILSASLGVAFDGTVAGLVVAVVALAVSYIRRRWYARYSEAIEALMTTILDKVSSEKEAGVALPSGFTEKDLPPFRDKSRKLVEEREQREKGEKGEKDGKAMQGQNTSDRNAPDRNAPAQDASAQINPAQNASAQDTASYGKVIS